MNAKTVFALTLVFLVAVAMTTIGVVDHFHGLGFNENIGAFITFTGLGLLAFFVPFSAIMALGASYEKVEV